MTRLTWAVLGLAAMLPGCLQAPPPPPPLPNDPQCDAAANNDPTVKQLRMLGAGSPYIKFNAEYDLANAVRQAKIACLQAKGIAPPGGVQQRRPFTGTY